MEGSVDDHGVMSSYSTSSGTAVVIDISHVMCQSC